MPNIDKQYSSFLGGEVSQRLWHRADMDKFGKWFADATNIRFRETGSFCNRGGFAHVANTKNNNPNDTVKILSFSFNDEQSYLVELGSKDGVGYARFFHDGKRIMDGSVPYEIVSPFSDLRGQTLKYAQAGDILFITNSKYGIWELRRLQADGSEWEFKKFTSTVMPMGELASEDGEYLSATSTTISTSGTFTITFASDVNLNAIVKPQLMVNGASFWSSSSTMSITELATQLTSALTSQEVTVTANSDNRELVFTCSDWSVAGIDSMAINIGEPTATNTTSLNVTGRPYNIDLSGMIGITNIKINSGSSVTTSPWYCTGKNETWRAFESSMNLPVSTFTLGYNVERSVNYNGSDTAENNLRNAVNILNSMLYSVAQLPSKPGMEGANTWQTSGTGHWVWKVQNGPLGNATFNNRNSATINIHPNGKYWQNQTIPNGRSNGYYTYADVGFNTNSSFFGIAGLRATTEKVSSNVNITITYLTSSRRTFGAVKQIQSKYGYLFSASPNTNHFFKDLKAGDTFAVKNHMQAATINQKFTTGSGTTSVVIGNGDYRYYTSGNWVGTINVQFSSDNGVTWKLLHTISSSNENAPGNDNTSGSLENESEYITQYRATYSITSGAVSFVFETSAYDIWSIYAIINPISNTQALTQCVKNDIGNIAHEEEYKKNAFSDTFGYPDCIGFYQNRLFFGKGYMVYASAVSDFWNFYQRAENLQDDDAIDMSLLSYRVNNIRNIVTDKAFFAFTGGGEFGIGSEGTLTQADKFLKQFSSHGSNEVDPVLTGDLVIFVDKTGNTTRALQYSLETDNYEATDVSIFLREKLENEQIIKTAYSYKEKEAYFLTESGIVFVMKYLPEQNILAWSHWNHAKATIKDICVVPNGANEDFYAVISHGQNLCIERLQDDFYFDSAVNMQNNTPISTINTHFDKGDTVGLVADGYRWYEITVGDNGEVTLPEGLTNIVYGLPYTSEATLLTPTIQNQDQTFTTYYLQRPFKVRFVCYESYGFKVGEATEEKFQIEWQAPDSSFDTEQALTTGFKSVSIVSKFGYDKKISFVQALPYPMDIQNVYIESDYGGK